MKATPGVFAFNSGELSPHLEGRADLKQYATGCYAMENFIPMVQGPARRRPGTRFVAEVKTSANRTALTEFIFNVNQSYILEWGNNYLRFYTNYAPVLSGGVPYEVSTPYAATDLYDSNGFFQLVFIQSADVVYITHRAGTFAPYKLSRFGATNWTLAPVVFVGGPFADDNPGTNPVVFASAETGSGITLSASADIFNAQLVNAYFQLTQQNIRDVRPWESGAKVTKGTRRRYNGVTYEALTGTDPTSGLPTTGTVPPTHLSGQAYDNGGSSGILWEYRDPGYGFVQITARGTNPVGVAATITAITAANPPVVTLSGAPTFNNGDLVFITGVVGMTEVNDKFFRASAIAGNNFSLQQDVAGGSPANVDGTNWDAYASGGTADNRVWTATANIITQAQAGTINRLPATVVGSQNATSIWAVGAWNARDGYPESVAFFRGRLVFGREGNVRLSVSEDFENFSALTPNALVTADMAISITLPTQDAIKWLVEGRALIAGTASTEHSIAEVNPSQALGPANIASRPQLRHGSRGVRPAVSGESLLWVQTSGLKIRGMKYAFTSDNYQSQDLTALAEHITLGGVTGFAWQQEPDAVLWMIRADGTLIGLTFNEEQSVIAWHRHPMTADAVVEAIATIPSSGGLQDDLWMIVRRTINGATKRYVEYLAPHFLSGDSLVTQAFYADCGVTGNGSTGTVTGLSYLEGRTVKVLADGTKHPDCVVTGGAITLQWDATTVQIGLPQTAKLTTMPLEAGSANGTSQGKIKRITNVNVRFMNTLGGKLGRDDPSNPVFDEILFRTPDTAMNEAIPVVSGFMPADTYSFPWPAGYEQEGRLTYLNDEPYPATVVGIYPEVVVAD